MSVVILLIVVFVVIAIAFAILEGMNSPAAVVNYQTHDEVVRDFIRTLRMLSRKPLASNSGTFGNRSLGYINYAVTTAELTYGYEVVSVRVAHPLLRRAVVQALAKAKFEVIDDDTSLRVTVPWKGRGN